MLENLSQLEYRLLQLAVMALVTYLVRMLPMTLFTKRITNRFLRSFLYYVPYAVLGAMTFPAIFFSTGGLISGIVGTAVGIVLAAVDIWRNTWYTIRWLMSNQPK